MAGIAWLGSGAEGPLPEASGDSQRNSAEITGSLGEGAFLSGVREGHLTCRWIEEPSRQNLRCQTTETRRGAGIGHWDRKDPTLVGITRSNLNTANQSARRVGRRVSSPPQLGRMASIERVHSGQKVHS